MTSKPVTGVRIKGNRVERVRRQSVSQKIGARKKVERAEKAWRKKSKQVYRDD